MKKKGKMAACLILLVLLLAVLVVLFYCLRKENTRGGVCIFPPSGDHRIYEHERGDTDHHGVSV